MTATETRGPVPPLPPLAASDATLATARANCAARCREKGAPMLAAEFEQGSQDAGWAMRHEVARLNRENGDVE